MTDASVNIEMHRLSPFYRDILTDIDFLGVISPHRDLAARLEARFRIPHVESHVIPGETRLPGTSTPGGGTGHFPNRYTEILANLTVPRPGAVYLVAAGLLGKIYCSHIKQRGGIAIDVGAVVDAWMGFDTRPGHFEATTQWMLPS
jgi:hypothetical protein